MLVSSLGKKVATLIGLSLWVIVGVTLGQLLAGVIVVQLPDSISGVTIATTAAALGYIFAAIITVGLPLVIKKKKLTFDFFGKNNLPTVIDVGVGFLGLLPYLLLASVVVWLGTDVFKFIDPEVGQQIGFSNLYDSSEYILAFITLVIMAPFAEEFLFRGYFQGEVARKVGKVASVVGVALVFGLFHLPGFSSEGVVWQWGAAMDTFSLGLVMGVMRLLTGTIWASVVLHMLKNGIAFYFLFIAQVV